MVYKIILTERALKDLSIFGHKVSLQIFAKIEYFESLKNPLSVAKSLKGKYKGFYRFRIGDYRAIFIIKPDGSIVILEIITIAHRREIYE